MGNFKPFDASFILLYSLFCFKKVEQETKKKSRRLAKFQRAITGATLEDIMKKRNQKPEVRKAQRDQAIRYLHSLIFLFKIIKINGFKLLNITSPNS
jgi:hypothetical protein